MIPQTKNQKIHMPTVTSHVDSAKQHKTVVTRASSFTRNGTDTSKPLPHAADRMYRNNAAIHAWLDAHDDIVAPPVGLALSQEEIENNANESIEARNVLRNIETQLAMALQNRSANRTNF
ncbi:MAG: hypothetical protein JWQ41_1915 [Variovorax sp.]|nr:hypothetical protein [Variovorax sp.]